MRNYKTWLGIALMITLFSCNNDDSSNETFKITGVVLSADDTPEENVTVSISDFQNLTTTTNSEGFFQIEGVAKGEQEVKLYKTQTDTDTNVFVQRTFKVALSADTDLEPLTLPNPVVLETPTDLSSSSALLSWNKSVSDRFREYKLYRHSSSGLDETTGTLVHVTTDINESSFLDDDLNNAETYYYRVFVLDEFGQIGGSNIISFETEPIQILKNGSFEDLSNEEPVEWTLIPNDLYTVENAIEIDNTDATEGQNSLKFTNADFNACYEQWIKQNIENNVLIQAATYRLVFDYKADFSLPDNNSVSLIIRNSSDLDEWLYMDVDFYDDGEWRNHTFEFTLPSQFATNNIDIDVHFCIAPTGSWWLDNMSIERVD